MWAGVSAWDHCIAVILVKAVLLGCFQRWSVKNCERRERRAKSVEILNVMAVLDFVSPIPAELKEDKGFTEQVTGTLLWGVTAFIRGPKAIAWEVTKEALEEKWRSQRTICKYSTRIVRGRLNCFRSNGSLVN